MSFKVLRKTAAGYDLALGGRTISVKSTVSLPLGVLLRARVVKGEGGIRLELLKEANPLEVLMGKLGLPRGAETEAVVRGLIQAKAPLDSVLIKRILAKAPKDPEARRLYARLAGLLGRKGVDLSRPGWETVVEAVLAGDGFGRDREEGRRRDEDEAEKNQEEITPGALKRMWAPGEKPNHLHLFNHLKSSEGHWVILPINSRFHGRRLSGNAAVQFSGEGAMEKVLLRIGREEREWRFLLGPEGPKGRRSLRLIGPESWKAGNRSMLGDFPEKLRNLGVDFDDNKRDELEEEVFAPGGVDWTV